MTSVRFEHINKSFGNVEVVHDLNLTVNDAAVCRTSEAGSKPEPDLWHPSSSSGRCEPDPAGRTYRFRHRWSGRCARIPGRSVASLPDGGGLSIATMRVRLS